MSTSKRWKSLYREIETLRKQFLPAQFDPLGSYPGAAHVQAHTRAFLVLSHAEIEGYLEAWAKEIARSSETVWLSFARMTTPLSFLLATLAERVPVPDTLRLHNAKDGPQRLNEAAVKLFQKYYKEIKDNNGIKEKNVLKLFGPLGIPATALGSTLLPNLESFGIIRGAHAHEPAKAVQAVLDPETEYKRVQTILTDLVPFDEWLVGYRRRVR